MQDTRDLETFDTLDYNDEIVYIGPDKFDTSKFEGSPVAPKDWKQPYSFRFVSYGGTLCCHTKFNGEKNLSPDHPANNPAYWRMADGGEVSE